MLIIKKGDILEAEENVICHQCNTEGIFGAGLAAQIKSKYPECEKYVRDFVSSYNPNELLGEYYLYETDKYTITNCFSQNVDYTTNLEALTKIFSDVFKQCSMYGLSVAIPYKYGCGIAKGDWSEVEKIFTDLSNKYNIDVVVYQIEGL